jgi:hypothetical protein
MKRLIIILLSVFVFCWGLNKILDYNYKKFWAPTFSKLDVVFNDTSYYDGIYIGDSRVHFGINPFYIDSVTGYKTFNIGMGGANLREKKLLTESYLINHPAPKFAVITLTSFDIINWNDSIPNPLYYLFYLQNSSAKNELKNEGHRVGLFSLCSILKYTSFDDYNRTTIFRNMIGQHFLQTNGVYYNGFINNPATNPFREDKDSIIKQKDTSYNNGCRSFIKFVQLLQSKRCKLIFVYPPTIYSHPKDPVFNKLESFFVSVADENHIPVLHFDQDPVFTKDLFVDEIHLTLDGSVLYSKKIGEVIQSVFPR